MKFSATSKKYNEIRICDGQYKMKFITVYSLSEYLQIINKKYRQQYLSALAY